MHGGIAHGLQEAFWAAGLEKFCVSGCALRTIGQVSDGRGRPPYQIFYDLRVGPRPMSNCLKKRPLYCN